MCDSGSKAAGPNACGLGVFVPPTVPSGKFGLVKTMDGKLREDLSFDSRIGEKYALIERKGGHNLKVGDKVEIVPLHCCGTVSLHDDLYCVRNDQVEGVWPIAARGKFS